MATAHRVRRNKAQAASVHCDAWPTRHCCVPLCAGHQSRVLGFTTVDSSTHTRVSSSLPPRVALDGVAAPCPAPWIPPLRTGRVSSSRSRRTATPYRRPWSRHSRRTATPYRRPWSRRSRPRPTPASLPPPPPNAATRLLRRARARRPRAHAAPARVARRSGRLPRRSRSSLPPRSPRRARLAAAWGPPARALASTSPHARSCNRRTPCCSRDTRPLLQETRRPRPRSPIRHLHIISSSSFISLITSPRPRRRLAQPSVTSSAPCAPAGQCGQCLHLALRAHGRDCSVRRALARASASCPRHRLLLFRIHGRAPYCNSRS